MLTYLYSSDRVKLEIPEIYASVATIQCDKCRRSGLGKPKGAPFYHCSLCKYDTCVECPLSFNVKGDNGSVVSKGGSNRGGEQSV